MADEQERQDEGIEAEAAHTPPVSGAPDENPEELEEHLEQSWERPADEDKSPTETAEALEAESEAYGPPEEDPETEREAVEEALEERGVAMVDEEESSAVAEMPDEVAEVEAELPDELEQVADEEAEVPADVDDHQDAGEAEMASQAGADPVSQAAAALAEQAEPVDEALAEVELADEAEVEVEAEAAAGVEDAVEAEVDEDEVEEEEDEPAVQAEEVDDGRHWYVIHCYSGQENKVRHNLEQRIDTMGMKDRIFDVVVPTEEEIEVKDGKRRTVERRVFPGYILVQMILSEESWYVVRNTPGVTGFVGMGNDPTPLRPEEVSQIIKRMEAEAPRIKVTYKIGQKVRIIDGPFNDFIGTVDDIDMERAKVRVMVSFFGRETPVELDFLQVERA
jgi:transcriptional antiterminator NusG